MKTIITQVFDEFTAHNLSGFARKSTVKKNIWLLGIRRQFDVVPDGGVQSSH
jgi:hypothetical protein